MSTLDKYNQQQVGPKAQANQQAYNTGMQGVNQAQQQLQKNFNTGLSMIAENAFNQQKRQQQGAQMRGLGSSGLSQLGQLQSNQMQAQSINNMANQFAGNNQNLALQKGVLATQFADRSAALADKQNLEYQQLLQQLQDPNTPETVKQELLQRAQASGITPNVGAGGSLQRLATNTVTGEQEFKGGLGKVIGNAWNDIWNMDSRQQEINQGLRGSGALAKGSDGNYYNSPQEVANLYKNRENFDKIEVVPGFLGMGFKFRIKGTTATFNTYNEASKQVDARAGTSGVQ